MSDYEILTDRAHFVVEYSERQTSKAGHTWTSNDHAEIIATDAYRVLEIFREFHPTAVVHVARRIGSHRNILVDRAARTSSDE